MGNCYKRSNKKPETIKNIIKLKSTICSSWGYGNKAHSVEEFALYLKQKKNYKVSTEHIPLEGGKGEFYVYQVLTDGTEKIIFSNNKDKHGNQAVIGFSLNLNKYDNIIEKIIVWLI